MPVIPEASFRPGRWLPIGYSIVGVQKAATSTLFDVLERHPQVAHGPFKEMQFFNAEELDWDNPDYRDYKAGRRAGRQVIAGDATPLYLFWPRALERMHAYNPDMRLIAIFRDPVERLFSQWAMQRDRGQAPDWPEFIEQYRSATLPTEVPTTISRQAFAARSGVSRGLYGQQLRRGLGIYPRDQWLLLEFRSLLADHAAALNQVTDFLGLRRFGTPPALPQLTKAPGSVAGTAPTGRDVAGLVELYAEDLRQFGELSGLDVGHWPTTRILRGDLDPAEVARGFARKMGSAATPS